MPPGDASTAVGRRRAGARCRDSDPPAGGLGVRPAAAGDGGGEGRSAAARVDPQVPRRPRRAGRASAVGDEK